MRVTFAEQVDHKAAQRVEAAFAVARSEITRDLTISRIAALEKNRSNLRENGYRGLKEVKRENPFKFIESELQLARNALVQSKKMLAFHTLELKGIEEQNTAHWLENEEDYYDLAVCMATVDGHSIMHDDQQYIVDDATNERLYGKKPHDPLGALDPPKTT